MGSTATPRALTPAATAALISQTAQWASYEIPRSALSTGGVKRLGELKLTSKSASVQSVQTYEVFAGLPMGSPSRLSWNIGPGVTFLGYLENLRGLKISELGLTVKGGVVFKLIPRLMDIGFSGYVNVFPLLLSPKDGTPAVRFYGVNGRVGFQLPFSSQTSIWSLLLGGYYFGMLVPGQAYGIRSIIAPQTVLQFSRAAKGSRFFYGYVKLAPLLDNLGLTLANRELAFGLGFQINSPLAKRAWMLTMDVSDSRFISRQSGGGFTLQTFSLGGAVGF